MFAPTAPPRSPLETPEKCAEQMSGPAYGSGMGPVRMNLLWLQGGMQGFAGGIVPRVLAMQTWKCQVRFKVGDSISVSGCPGAEAGVTCVSSS